MANALYDLGRQGFLDGSIDWDTAVIRVALMTSGYTANTATDQFFSTASASGTTNLVGVPMTLGTKSVTGGVADAADVTYPLVASGSTISQLIIYQASAVAPGATSVSTSGTVGTVGTWGTYQTAVVTGLSAVGNLAPGSNITSTGTGAVGANAFVRSVDSASQITIAATSGMTAGALTNISTTDVARTSQRLIARIDQVDAAGVALPITTNNGDIVIQWDNTTNRIFKL